MSDADKAVGKARDSVLIEILRDISKGNKNELGDLWGLHYCDRAADTLEQKILDVEKLQKQNAALLSAATLTVRRIGETGDAVSINALNKAIGACRE